MVVLFLNLISILDFSYSYLIWVFDKGDIFFSLLLAFWLILSPETPYP
jgi:hypothetical protein